MALANHPFHLVLELTLAGVDAAGLTAANLNAVTIQRTPEVGVSPAAVILAPTVDFTLEELASGAYCLRVAASVLSEEGTWTLRVADAGGLFAPIRMVVIAETATSEERSLWAAGINTFGVAATYDTDGRVTNFTVFGFSSEADTAIYANEYAATGGLVTPATQALVRSVLEETFVYSAEGRLVSRTIREIS